VPLFLFFLHFRYTRTVIGLFLIKNGNMAGKLFIISAPSGAGKTTLVRALVDRFGTYYALERVITYTSKTPRSSEVRGHDYHFLSAAEFEEKIEKNFFMEWSKAYDAYYGSPRHIIDHLPTGKSYVVILDRVGAQQAAEVCSEAVLIWLYTKSIEHLRDRLIGRNADLIDVIERRLRRAQEEIDQELQGPLYQYHVLNDDFEKALKRIVTIIKRELYSL